MNKFKLFFITGIFLLILMIIFIINALQHPEMTFIGGNKVAYPFYGLYLLTLVIMFALSLKYKKK